MNIKHHGQHYLAPTKPKIRAQHQRFLAFAGGQYVRYNPALVPVAFKSKLSPSPYYEMPGA